MIGIERNVAQDAIDRAASLIAAAVIAQSAYGANVSSTGGNIVASVRRGTGVLVMANDGVLIEENAFENNPTAHIMVVAYTQPFTDERYNPYARNVIVGFNAFGRGGDEFDVGEVENSLVFHELGPKFGVRDALQARAARPKVQMANDNAWIGDIQVKGDLTKNAFRRRRPPSERASLECKLAGCASFRRAATGIRGVR